MKHTAMTILTALIVTSCASAQIGDTTTKTRTYYISGLVWPDHWTTGRIGIATQITSGLYSLTSADFSGPNLFASENLLIHIKQIGPVHCWAAIGPAIASLAPSGPTTSKTNYLTGNVGLIWSIPVSDRASVWLGASTAFPDNMPRKTVIGTGIALPAP